MAKKKTRSKQAGRPPLPRGKLKDSTFTMRATDDWKDWLAEFANSCGFDKSILIDQSLREFAKAKGFKPPPKR